ncbi:MAG: DEAD/DEAH box helicase [Mongoliitalea sp.]
MSKNLSQEYAEFLIPAGIESLNEMQLDFIKQSRQVDQLMLLSPTGSGKTLAFLLPLLDTLDPQLRATQAIIIVPSRELAIQIEQVFKSLKSNFRVSTCYGGHSAKLEQQSLTEGPAVVIGTPGRLSDHILRESLSLQHIKTIVLDEFDKSLQMGFHEQLRVIFKALTGKEKHILTSATKLDRMPDFLPFQKPHLINYLKDEVESKLELKVVHTSSKVKVETLMRLVAGFQHEACLVFCNHREAVDRISLLLNDYGFEHGVLHGGMEQLDREKNLIKFRSGVYNLLIATDLASRGLDIPEIKHVVHYQLPPKKDAFTHRNGRTARMHAKGQGYLILANDEELPEYIDKTIEELELSEELTPPTPTEFACLYFSAGKKDKISKGDIVGLLTKKGGLSGKDIGMITVLDYASYVAIKRTDAAKTIQKVDQEKLKKVKIRVAEAN